MLVFALKSSDNFNVYGLENTLGYRVIVTISNSTMESDGRSAQSTGSRGCARVTEIRFHSAGAAMHRVGRTRNSPQTICDEIEEFSSSLATRPTASMPQ
ncbi:hypothetical protein EVAR_46962_1 [Eumeta japonica]|uniref:Uncharacterized protein n=1 Tax=Eumeta variegata TaxID=151549 RepID=A0A4C1YM53_EUMVA|nr:hypothetical protein EVAR_46962_1 [Eumeta japonica]